jgi:hypothetical protein
MSLKKIRIIVPPIISGYSLYKDIIKVFVTSQLILFNLLKLPKP